MKRVLIAVVLLIALSGIAAVSAVAYLSHESYRAFENETFVTVPRGTGTAEIGRTLAQAGVIRYPWEIWIQRLRQPSAKIQAGEYRFDKSATPGEVYARLARGDIFYFEFTVPEGSNIFDIAASLEQQGIMPALDFQNAASDPTSIQDLAPNAPSLEGFLFPSTYRITHSTTAADLCKQMTDTFRRQWRRAGGASADVQQTVTLASLVEKETGVAQERPLVAGVFANRLRIGMRLECDPTTIYAALLDNRYSGVIHKSDLASQNPYNTYQHAGLPPGPIANPGLDSIQAALHPTETNYLFFVAKPEGGGHNFSTDLHAHNAATKAYRKKSNSRR
jgi:UPF0755 protein